MEKSEKVESEQNYAEEEKITFSKDSKKRKMNFSDEFGPSSAKKRKIEEIVKDTGIFIFFKFI